MKIIDKIANVGYPNDTVHTDVMFNMFTRAVFTIPDGINDHNGTSVHDNNPSISANTFALSYGTGGTIKDLTINKAHRTRCNDFNTHDTNTIDHSIITAGICLTGDDPTG